MIKEQNILHRRLEFNATLHSHADLACFHSGLKQLPLWLTSTLHRKMTEAKRQRAAEKGSIYLAVALEYIELVK